MHKGCSRRGLLAQLSEERGLLVEIPCQSGGSGIVDAATVRWLLQKLVLEEVGDLDQCWPDLVSIWA